MQRFLAQHLHIEQAFVLLMLSQVCRHNSWVAFLSSQKCILICFKIKLLKGREIFIDIPWDCLAQYHLLGDFENLLLRILIADCSFFFFAKQEPFFILVCLQLSSLLKLVILLNLKLVFKIDPTTQSIMQLFKSSSDQVVTTLWCYFAGCRTRPILFVLWFYFRIARFTVPLKDLPLLSYRSLIIHL